MMSLHLTLSYNIQIDNYFFLAVKLIHGTTLAMIVLRAAQYAQLRYAWNKIMIESLRHRNEVIQ